MTSNGHERKLGFTTRREYDGLLILTKDTIELHLWLCHDPAIPQNSSVYFHVTEIETLFEHCERVGIVHPKGDLEDKPWGIKEFYATDPDQNLLKFAQFR
ncbi:hypothetical protein [Chryseolinea lacunae]|uniref:VOC domain-containing protein n=1 Tax=Chryseolinea lacunae TaxID=2801331 RepID=A0ABS1KWQ9_9BACT|nr:hypothetical protein [Chryseolinea lacunae]MBL0743906.1 hypothetical protein [Chryseolinea lacunae]